MQLMTKEPLIVFYDIQEQKYTFCGTRYFKNNYKESLSVPILYTGSIYVARHVIVQLNYKIKYQNT